MDTLAPFVFSSIVWAGCVILLFRKKIWLFYYIVGSVGCALLLIIGGTTLFPLERWLETATAFSAHWICQILSVPTNVFTAAPGNILVWVVVQNPGWTVIRVDLECSGLLEMSVFTGLLLFYPMWRFDRRLLAIVLGWGATFFANIIRIFSIILILHLMGKRSLFVAHTIAGRFVFFVLVMVIFWLFLTRPTLQLIASRLKRRMKG